MKPYRGYFIAVLCLILLAAGFYIYRTSRGAPAFYDRNGDVLPTFGTVRPDVDSLEGYLAIMCDFLSDGNSETPMLAACGYSCEYQRGLPAKRADVSFDIVYAAGVTAHVRFTGTDLLDSVALPVPIPYDEADFSYTIENVTGSITF